MKLFTEKIFDGCVDGALTAIPFEASASIYAFQVVVLDAQGSADPHLFVMAETSDDGTRWSQCTSGGSFGLSGYLVYNQTIVRGTPANFDAYITPSTDTLKRWLRITVTNSTGSSSCRVKVYVTQRARITPKGMGAEAEKSGSCGCSGKGCSAKEPQKIPIDIPQDRLDCSSCMAGANSDPAQCPNQITDPDGYACGGCDLVTYVNMMRKCGCCGDCGQPCGSCEASAQAALDKAEMKALACDATSCWKELIAKRGKNADKTYMTQKQMEEWINLCRKQPGWKNAFNKYGDIDKLL